MIRWIGKVNSPRRDAAAVRPVIIRRAVLRSTGKTDFLLATVGKTE